MTVKGAGFEVAGPANAGEIAEPDVAQAAEAARTVFAGEPAFEAQIGLPAAFPEVVISEVWNVDRVTELNARLMSAIPALPRYPFDGPLFLPHISIARFTSSDGLSRLKQVLGSMRDEAPGPALRVRRVDLVRAHLSARGTTFETIASYPLV